MSRLQTLALIFLLAGCGSGQRVCDGNCPDVSGSFSLLQTMPMGECAFASYVPPPTLTLTQSDDGRHVSTQLIDPINQLLVSMVGNVLAPDASDQHGNFRIETQLLRQASRTDSRLFSLEVIFTGSVARTDGGGATLASTLTEVQQQPGDGAGCTITISLPGRMGGP